MPEVSVVMTVYNGEDHLQEAISSVLAQTYTDWEFIIVNDGSEDATREIVASYSDTRIKLINQQNTGLGVAANNGIRQAGGKWIARIDDDDIWAPDKLALQMEFLSAHPDHFLVGSNAMAINHRGETLYPIEMPARHEQITEIIMGYNPFIHSSVIFSKKAFDAIGGYYEPMNKYMIDYLLFYQFSKMGKVANLTEKLVRYRISTSSIGHSFGSEHPEVSKLIRKSIKNEGLQKQDRERLIHLKQNQFPNPRHRKAQYYFFSGRALLFYAHKRTAAIRDLFRSLTYDLFKPKTWVYIILAIFAPSRVIDKIHQRFLSSHLKQKA